MPKVVTRRCLKQDLNPRPTDHKSNALPLHHRVPVQHKYGNISETKDLLALRSLRVGELYTGIFVALTLTAVAAVLVFWRKSNSVFALQKCEQQDVDDKVLTALNH